MSVTWTFRLTTVTLPSTSGGQITQSYASAISDLRSNSNSGNNALITALQAAAGLGAGATVVLVAALVLSFFTVLGTSIAAARLNASLSSAPSAPALLLCGAGGACLGAKATTITCAVLAWVCTLVGSALGWACGGTITSYFLTTQFSPFSFTNVVTFDPAPAGSVCAGLCFVLSLIAFILESSRHCCVQPPPVAVGGFPPQTRVVVINPTQGVAYAPQMAPPQQQVQQWPAQQPQVQQWPAQQPQLQPPQPPAWKQQPPPL